jgi:hypothetical protein
MHKYVDTQQINDHCIWLGFNMRERRIFAYKVYYLAAQERNRDREHSFAYKVYNTVWERKISRPYAAAQIVVNTFLFK